MKKLYVLLSLLIYHFHQNRNNLICISDMVFLKININIVALLPQKFPCVPGCHRPVYHWQI